MKPEEVQRLLSSRGLPQTLLDDAWETRLRHRGREMRFYYPHPRFPAVSITGEWCALRCKHCMGKYLKGMTPIKSPEKLKEFSIRLEEGDGVGILVSGGCTPDGRVPLERFYDALRWIKRHTELIINVHTGLVDERRADEVASTGIDIASVDVVGSDETIRRVYGLRATVEDYRKTLNSLMETSIPAVVPHLCVGLDYGRILGEAKALEIIWEAQPRQMVILALIPTPGTPMEEVRPPPPRDVAKVATLARLLMPETSISLGCMRPRAERESLETLCLKAGADRMVLPSRATRSWAESQDLKILELDGCCSIPEKLEARALRA